MRKKNLIISCFLLLVATFTTLFISSCDKEENSIDNSVNQTSSTAKQSEGLVVLGKQLEDPYAIKNMKLAYSNLKSTNSGAPDVDIKPTHYYLRFLPKNEEEWAILKSDTTFVLYDFPLDYEIEYFGTYYHDPSLPDTAITYQYCVLQIGHDIPSIQNELLYEVYIPEVDENENLKSSSAINQFLIDLEYESVWLTGNLTQGEINLKSTQGIMGSLWTPKGTIIVWDNDLGWIPLVQASVHARWFTHIETDLTNENGYFETSQFRYEVNYAIKWERADFDIRSGNWDQAWYSGPKQRGDWNLEIGQGGMSWIYAHIHRGAYIYYYANTYGIKTPPLDGGLLNQRIHIGAMENSGRSHYYDFNKFWLSPQIKIYAYTDAGNWETGESIFGTTIHELAHASHWEIGYNYGQYVVDAIFSEPFLPESWAYGVESVITSNTYGNNWYQDQGIPLSSILGNGGYTPIVWDMIDNFNQRTNYGVAYPIDNVSDYSLTQLENALYNNNTWTSWRDAIINNYDNPSESYLNELFGNYK